MPAAYLPRNEGGKKLHVQAHIALGSGVEAVTNPGRSFTHCHYQCYARLATVPTTHDEED